MRIQRTPMFFGRRVYVVWSNARSLGCNLSARFDVETGELQRVGFAPR